MRSDVLFFVRQLLEIAVTNGALVRPNAQMNAIVLTQVASVGESLLAGSTAKGFGFVRVRRRMHLQIVFALKHLICMGRRRKISLVDWLIE